MSSSKLLLKASGRDGELQVTMEQMEVTTVDALKRIEDGEGRNVLHRAAEAGALQNVRFLVNEVGFPVSLRDAKYKTPLMYAVKFPDILRVLLAAGASPSEFKANSWTPLHYAAKCGETDSVQQLLDSGADASAQNKEGASALYVAAREGCVDAVRCLLASAAPSVQAYAPAELAAAAEGGEGGADTAAGQTHTMMDLPVDEAARVGALVTQTTLRGRTPLHAAVLGGNASVLRLLLKALRSAGYEPLCDVLRDIVDASGQSLQHEATDAGSAECAQVLAGQGGLGGWPPHVAPDAAGRLPIHTACLRGNADMLKWLLETAPVDGAGGAAFPDEGGSTALYHACCSGAQQCVELLLAAGADPAQGNPRRPAIYIAALNGHVDAVQACTAALLGAGMQVTDVQQLKDAEGQVLIHSITADMRKALGWDGEQ